MDPFGGKKASVLLKDFILLAYISKWDNQTRRISIVFLTGTVGTWGSFKEAERIADWEKFEINFLWTLQSYNTLGYLETELNTCKQILIISYNEETNETAIDFFYFIQDIISEIEALDDLKNYPGKGKNKVCHQRI